MLAIYASLALGFLFVLVGGVNVWLVLEGRTRGKSADASSRMMALHRIGGYLFIALFCAMTYFMVARLRSGAADTSANVAIHLALAMILFPLLFIKVLIARYYGNQHGLLMPIGLTIFVLAFALIASTAGPYLARAGRIETPLRGSRNSAELKAARALVDHRCGRCHNLDRVYGTIQTPQQWRETVNRMVEYAAGSTGALQPGEDEQIIDFLSATQTQDAAKEMRAQVDAASSAGRSLIVEKGGSSPLSVTKTSPYDGKTIGFISFVFVAGIVLVIRRPRTHVAPPVKLASQSEPPPAIVPRPPDTPFLLQLVRINRQTADSKTLRFAVGGGRTLAALPGQFLAFSFLFDGRKEVRCYSICSSPARTGYVEITPKRVGNGCVSVFLNDRACVGTTVEATGPFGQFYLNHANDKKIVLLAAGSGITPMMSMLRYMDDLCLGTETTLLYCVRTAEDIFFREELEQLEARLASFRHHVLLSQPNSDWAGGRGHISREFVCKTVPEPRDRVFFLCGPPGFMDAARAILTSLGVAPERIRQETFGGVGAPPGASPRLSSENVFTLAFAKSRKTTTVAEGQTLLEAAAEAGVLIPSACRQGQCGTCKTRLLEGRVRMTTENGLDPESKSGGFVLTCVGYAEGNVTLEA